MPLDPNPYAPPRSDVDEAAPRRATKRGPLGRIEGDLLVVPNGESLPPVCLKCGIRDDIRYRRQTFYWAPPWSYALVPLLCVIGAAVVAILQKKADFALPLCAACDRRWTLWTFASVGIALMALPIYLGVTTLPRGLTARGFLYVGLASFGAWLSLGSAFTWARRRALIAPRRIDNVETWLSGVHRQAMRVIVDGWS